MNAFLIRGLLKDPAIRFAVTECAPLCSEAVIRHDADPAGAAVLGEALIVSSMLPVLLDEAESYCIRLQYNGQAGKIIAEANDRAEIRGFSTAPQLGLLPLDQDRIFGDTARVSLIRSAGARILNSGETESHLASPAADIAFFFSVSDQVETAANAALRFNPDPKQPVASARGILLQAMPQCDPIAFEEIRKQVERVPFRTGMLDAAGTPEDIAMAILQAAGCDVSPGNLVFGQTIEPRFQCRCSREKLLQALLTVDRRELEQMFREQPELAMRCEFCGTAYRFSAGDLPEA